MIFMGDQSLPTGCKRWGGGGTVESCLPFYCHQGEGGHKNTKELGGISGKLFRVTTKFLQRKKFVKTIYN